MGAVLRSLGAQPGEDIDEQRYPSSAAPETTTNLSLSVSVACRLPHARNTSIGYHRANRHLHDPLDTVTMSSPDYAMALPEEAAGQQSATVTPIDALLIGVTVESQKFSS
jgi:hypothetical protein